MYKVLNDIMGNIVVFWDGLGYNKFYLILLIIFFLGHLIFLFYRSAILMSKGRIYKEKGEEGVSVILTCSNKAELLRQNLEAFLKQDYPSFEVVVVDECSEDETQEVLSELQKKYPHLQKHLQLESKIKDLFLILLPDHK